MIHLLADLSVTERHNTSRYLLAVD